MRTLPDGLQTHLDSGTTTLCWCWKITRSDGVELGFTEHDEALTFGGLSYEPDSGLGASEIRSSADLSVDSQDAEGALISDRISEADILAGIWDGAVIEVHRVNWADTDQRILMRKGVLGEVRRGRRAFTAEMRSLSHTLNQPAGRTFQFNCDAGVGDSRCKVNLDTSAFKGSAAISSVLSDRSFVVGTGLEAYASGWFERGLLTWTNGNNSGRSGEVRTHFIAGADTTLKLLEPPPKPLTVSDGFSVTAGCNKSTDQCSERFSNIANFRGFPHMPGDRAVIRFAKRGKGYTGGALTGS